MKALVYSTLVLLTVSASLWASDREDILAREAEITSECRQRWQSIASRADRIVAVPAVPRAGASKYEISDPVEVRSLLDSLRFVRPDFDWTTHERFGVVHACRCIGEVRISIFHGDEEIAQLLTRHGKYIEGGAVTSDTRMEIEETWLVGIYQKLGVKVMKKGGEPGATDNPDDAQRLREDH